MPGPTDRVRGSPPPLLLIAFFLAGLLYLSSVPLFEAPDESYHFAFADTISRNRNLPVQLPGEKTPWGQEGSQPPLYYILVAALITPIDTSDLAGHLRFNPHAIVGDPSAVDNQNIFLHDHPAPPLRDTVLAVYVARVFSLLLACGSVAAVWLAAREFALLTGERAARLALLGAGLVAFNPQFLFISASVNNDNLVTLLASLTIWQMLAMLRQGLNARRSVILALLLACATMAKLSALLLYAPVGLAALWLARRSNNTRELLRLVVFAGLAWLVIAGPWYARNLTLYGEFTGSQTMLDVVGRRSAPSLEKMLGEEFRGLRYSYWGIFGWFNVFSPAPFYLVMDLVTLAAVAGLLRRAWGRRRWPAGLFPAALLTLCLALFAIALVLWTRQTAATQGRLLFPASAASMTLLAYGLLKLRIPAHASLVALGLVAVALPFTSIRPAYAPPAIVAGLPEDATPLPLRFGDVELLGYRLEGRRHAPGDILPVTLYWRPTRRSEQDFSFFLRLLDDEDRLLVNRYGHPGSGMLRTTRWQPGLVYEDRWDLKIPEDLTGRTALRVHIGWWKYPDGYALPGVNAGGEEADPVILKAGAFSDGDDRDRSLAQVIDPLFFGDSIRLLAWERDELEISLLWEVASRPQPDLHVFLHFLEASRDDAPGRIVAQGDAAPDLPTGFWLEGERYVTRHHLQWIEAESRGELSLHLGWYSLEHGWRLPADCPNDSCLLTTLTLAPKT